MKWENKQWSFGAFNDILPKLAPEGYKHNMFLAHGAFGRASKVSLSNGRIFILKDVNMNKMDTEADKEKALREYRIHHALVHDNITRFEMKGTHIDIPNGRIQMVQEYATNGTLDDVIKNLKKTKTRLSETRVRYIAVDLLAALGYAHEKGVIHRDVKGENTFVMISGAVKLGDLGVSYMVAEIHLEKGQVQAGSGAGTWNFMAPEVVMIRLNKAGRPEFYTVKADIWSLGATIYHVLVLKVPFNKNSLKMKWYKSDIGMPAMPDYVSQSMQEFVNLLMHRDADRRPSAKEALLSVFLLPATKATVAMKRFLQKVKQEHKETRNIREMGK